MIHVPNETLIVAICAYLLIGFFFALGVLAILKAPPEYDPNWEDYRAAFFVDPNWNVVLVFTVCILFWPGIVFFPFKEPS